MATFGVPARYPAGRDTERSEKMLEQEMVQRDFGSVDGRAAGLVGSGGEF